MLSPERQALLGLLRRRSRLQRVQGLPRTFTKAEIIRKSAKVALEDFQSLPEFQVLGENSKELVRRLFLRTIVLLNVAADFDPEEALRLNDETNEVLAPLLKQKPKLRIV